MGTKRKLKPIPKFKTEADEAKFWATHSSTNYIDWSKAKIVRGKRKLRGIDG